MLLENLAKGLKASHVLLLHINLRDVSFNSVDTLVSTLHEEINSWVGQFKDVAKQIKLDAEACGSKFSAYTYIENKILPLWHD